MAALLGLDDDEVLGLDVENTNGAERWAHISGERRPVPLAVAVKSKSDIDRTIGVSALCSDIDRIIGVWMLWSDIDRIIGV